MQPPAPRTLASCAISVTYPGSAEHVRAVRAEVRAVLRDCPMADDVILCASELAANAALHSNSRLYGGTFAVRVMISPGNHVRIEVEDDGGHWSPAASDPTGHHGLDILRALASDWGIDGDHSSRIIWASFDWYEKS
jgi:serine/threonine-protein kinase RsbW